MLFSIKDGMVIGHETMKDGLVYELGFTTPEPLSEEQFLFRCTCIVKTFDLKRRALITK